MSAQTLIDELVRTKLAGRKIDVVGFVDALLELSSETGEIQCRLASENALGFHAAGLVWETEVDASRGKLRMLCARLGALCNETNSAAVSPYGGEGLIRVPSVNGKGWMVQFKNTPDYQEFRVISSKIEVAANV